MGKSPAWPAPCAHAAAADAQRPRQRDGPGFEPYQYSKAESERLGWALAKEVGIEMVSLCPPMIFGPPRQPHRFDLLC